MRWAEEGAPAREGAFRNFKNEASGPDPLEAVIDATAADRLGWALLEQGIDPVIFELADDLAHPGTVVVRTTLATAVRGLIAVWWDASVGEAIGLCAGSSHDKLEAAAVLKTLTARGPGDLPFAPPEDPFDPWTVIVAAAHRLGLKVRSRPLMMDKPNRNVSAIFAVRDWLASEDAAELGLKASDRAVLLALVTHMHRDGLGGRPGAKRIGAITGYSKQTAARALRRLRDAALIEPQVAHPHFGNAQVWRLTEAFVAMLEGVGGAERERGPLEASSDDSGPPATQEGASSDIGGGLPRTPKAAESSIESSSSGEVEIDVDKLAAAKVARKIAAGEKVENPKGFARKIALEDRKELIAEEEDRKAQAARDRAFEECDRCDQDGWLWIEADGTLTTRGEAPGIKCNHAGDLEWATANVVDVFPGAEVAEEASA